MDKLKGLANKLGHKGEGNTAADPNAPASNADPGATNPAGSTQKGDFLDQGVGMANKQFTGKELSREDQEKYSDYARQGFQKGTGREIPIKDQNIQQ
ncbi:hypothetical protein P389DRAFT_172084 [Cystobasidium minutum MCA 4210]|uniref:uncharacterized protein n=1 Tax=Cystobasidium minutum MCA 4210 TaxID=1397322 RepID=UPI0034CD03BA|eukprot:jgi/Rhomi1/172084/fgenesh1_kg.4_\